MNDERSDNNLLAIALTVLIAVVPPIYISYLISQSGDIPHFDYWWIIKHFYSLDGFSSNPGDWIFRNNEHLLLIPSLVYALNIFLAKGSNIGLCLFAFSFALIQCGLLISLLPNHLKQFPSLRILLIWCISIFNFTPSAAHNWMRGFSGVIWMGANLFVIASIACLVKVANKDSRCQTWIAGSIIFGILAALNYSTSLGLWPVLCGAALILRFPRRLIWLYIGVSSLVLILYFATYKTPEHHPSLSNLGMGDTLAYIPIYLGAIFTRKLYLAFTIGIIGLIAATGLAIYWFVYRQRSGYSTRSPALKEWLPWLAIQVYTLETAVMAAISRSGFGLGQARSSRYASLPALFWLSLTVIAISWIVNRCRDRPPNLDPVLLGTQPRRWLIVAFTVVASFTVGMYGVGGSVAEAIALRAAKQPLIALSLQLDAPDPVLVREVIGNRPAAFLGLADALKVNGLVPFTQNIKLQNPCVPLDRPLDANLLNPHPSDSTLGYFDAVTVIPSATSNQNSQFLAARVTGWAGTDNDSIRCIAIVNQENVVRGFALSGFPRPDVVELMGDSYERSGWKGYIRQPRTADESFAAYASFTRQPGWVALRNSHKLLPLDSKSNVKNVDSTDRGPD